MKTVKANVQRSTLNAQCSAGVLSTARFFSLAPTGGEGWEEGERRPADRGLTELSQPFLKRREPATPSPASARPLAPTLSPDGGEGTRISFLVPSLRSLRLFVANPFPV